MKKVIILLITIMIISCFLVSCSFESTPTYITTGFSSKLLTCLYEKYEITIPDNAEFISGYFTNGFRDSYIIVVFKVDTSQDIAEILSDNWKSGYNKSELIESIKDEFNIECNYVYYYIEQDFTKLQYSDNVDGYINCILIGYRPGDSFS